MVSGMLAALTLLIAVAVLSPSLAFKDHEFRYCKDTSFCRRHRKFDGTHAPATFSAHNLKQEADGTVSGELRNEMDAQKPLKLSITALDDGTFRVLLNEQGRYHVQDVMIIDPQQRLAHGTTFQTSDGVATYTNGARQLVIQVAPKPFTVKVMLDGVNVIALNERNLMKWEVYRDKGAPGALEDVTGDNDGLWEESFGAHRDTRPKGPASIGMDIDFLAAQHVYGLSERASSFSLKNTKGTGAPRDEPYRLYNLDVFEYDVTPDRAHQPLYGAIPLMLSHTAKFSTGLLWLNAAETMVDVEDGDSSKRTHWFSESGVIDLYLMTASTPAGVQGQYALLVGTQFMPPLFSLGYHQCRWNYKDEADVRMVDGKFDEHDIPYDVIWLDIEHTVGKRYMTWDRHLFPEPEVLQNELATRGRKTVTIVDPHLKVDMGYHVYSEAKNLGYFVKTKDGGDFEGHCWPGASSWLDYLNPKVRDYWASRFLTENYKGSTVNLYTWNDMNEPSVFNGPEITMQKDLRHHDGIQSIEHRDVHNVYGFYMTMATAAGHALLRPNRRPFILSRAFYSGSQRYVAVWTGDNMAKWSHLEAATPMLLQLSMTGIQFCGADVGGFFNNPDEELLVRWYQSAAYTPFFRGHAHLDTKRREPWLFGEAAMVRIRTAIRNRYALMPYIYLLFHGAHTTGMPIIRPLWFEFPADEQTFGMDDQLMLGTSLLIKPVTQSGVSSLSVYLPTNPSGPPTKWYPFKGSNAGKAGLFKKLWSQLQGKGGTEFEGGSRVKAEASIDAGVPVFQRGGSIIPTKERARRSTSAMSDDPYTLHVALSHVGLADGEVYADDGDTVSHEKGEYALFKLNFDGSTLTCKKIGGESFTFSNKVERIVMYGLAKPPTKITVSQMQATADLEYTYDKEAKVLVVRKPDVEMQTEWSMTIQ